MQESIRSMIISLPPHMRTAQQLTPEEWIASWCGIPIRSEVKMLARDYADNGFTDSGWPTHPRVGSIISEDTGRSEATIKRFHRKAKELGMLTEVGSHIFHDGMRATPMYALTMPVEAVSAPAALDGEMDALVELGRRVEASMTGWQNTSQPPPEWATGC